MKQEPKEAEVRKLYLELRREDRRRMPAFTTVWAASVVRHRRQRFGLCLQRVAAVAAVAALLVHHRAARDGRRAAEAELPWKSTVLISQWRAPTDFLLEPPSSIRMQEKKRPRDL